MMINLGFDKMRDNWPTSLTRCERIWKEMHRWLNEHRVSFGMFNVEYNEWRESIPKSLYITDTEDALAFKIRFGLQ